MEVESIMATRTGKFILPGSALVSQNPRSLPSSQIIECRSHIPQSPPTKDKKELSLLQVPGQTRRYFGLWQRRWREKSPGAMLYNKNVEAGSDEAAGDADDGHHLGRGLLSQHQLTSGGQESLASDLSTDHSTGESMYGINSDHMELRTDGDEESRVNRGSCMPSREVYRKGNKQYHQHAGVSVESVGETDGDQELYQADSGERDLQDHHLSVTTIGAEDLNPLQVLQEAKFKEIACCILAIKRLKLVWTRTISRTLRNFKGTIKDEQKAEGTLLVDETEAEARIRDECTEKTEKPSGSKRDDELDEIPWDVLKRLWENPAFVKFRVSVSMANLTMALPTFLSRALPLLSSLNWQTPLKGFSFPVLAPLLFGGGIVFKSAVSNLGFVLPRMLMSMAIMWVLWALNHVIQEAIQHLKDNGTFDRRVTSVLVLFFELTFSAIAVVTVLSSIGLNVKNLLLPSFLALALAGKDVWQNYFAGFFLFAAQPFRPGHSVALMCGHETRGPQTANLGVMKSAWFEGVCEAVDLRYTVLRNGRYRLMVPNATFVKREFIIIDPELQESEPSKKQQSRRAKLKQRANNVDSGVKFADPPTGSSPSMSSSTAWDVYVGDISGNGALSKSPNGSVNGSA